MSNFTVPFSLTATGQVSTTTNTNQVASDRMESLIGTYPGERVMLPDYGVSIPSYLFASDFTQQQNILAIQIQDVAAQWEPTLTVNDINVTTNEQEPGITSVSVQYSLSANPQLTASQTAILLIGGSIING